MEPITLITDAKAPVLSAVQFKGVVGADGTFEGFPTREDPSRNPIETAVLVPTANGGTPAFPGDWIVSDVSGKLSVVSNSHFTAHYKAPASSKPFVPVPQLTPQQIAARRDAPLTPPVPAVPHVPLTPQQIAAGVVPAPALTPQQIAAQQAAAPALTPQQIAAQQAAPKPPVPPVPPVPGLTPQQIAAQQASAQQAEAAKQAADVAAAKQAADVAAAQKAEAAKNVMK